MNSPFCLEHRVHVSISRGGKDPALGQESLSDGLNCLWGC